MSTFDPKLLEEAIIDAPNATSFEPIPEGVYPAICDGFEIRTAKTEDGDRAILRLMWSIMDDSVKELLGREVVISRQDIWLDLNTDGSIATGPGQNVQLGRAREACKINKVKGFNFAMFRDAGPVNATIVQKPDKKTGEIYSNVAYVSAPS